MLLDRPHHDGSDAYVRAAEATCGQTEQPARERGNPGTEKPTPSEDDEELPTLNELAEMLAGK